jgi:hypothetical protein
LAGPGGAQNTQIIFFAGRSPGPASLFRTRGEALWPPLLAEASAEKGHAIFLPVVKVGDRKEIFGLELALIDELAPELDTIANLSKNRLANRKGVRGFVGGWLLCLKGWGVGVFSGESAQDSSGRRTFSL